MKRYLSACRNFLGRLVGKMVMDVMGLRYQVMIKKEAFFFPLGPLLRSAGGIPVDRRNAAKLPETVAAMLRDSREMALLICPEGTRKSTEHWKRGFYFIAQKANVPIFGVQEVDVVIEHAVHHIQRAAARE